MATVSIHGVSKTFFGPDGEPVEALGAIDLHVRDGEFVCLLGPSGCGKSTLLNIVAGLESSDTGEVRVARQEGGNDAQPTLAYMFQESRLLPWMTVQENLHFVLDTAGPDRRRRVAEWLGRVGLADFAHYYPNQLSIGMQQRVAVARALIVQPDVLLMDEPFSSLDELTAMTMREHLLELWHEQRATVLFVTHNPMEATLLADRVAVMSAGPGRLVDTLDLTDRLPRPRDPDDAKLWRISREAVRKLRERGEGALAGS